MKTREFIGEVLGRPVSEPHLQTMLDLAEAAKGEKLVILCSPRHGRTQMLRAVEELLKNES